MARIVWSVVGTGLVVAMVPLVPWLKSMSYDSYRAAEKPAVNQSAASPVPGAGGRVKDSASAANAIYLNGVQIAQLPVPMCPSDLPPGIQFPPPPELTSSEDVKNAPIRVKGSAHKKKLTKPAALDLPPPPPIASSPPEAPSVPPAVPPSPPAPTYDPLPSYVGPQDPVRPTAPPGINVNQGNGESPRYRPTTDPLPPPKTTPNYNSRPASTAPPMPPSVPPTPSLPTPPPSPPVPPSPPLTPEPPAAVTPPIGTQTPIGRITPVSAKTVSSPWTFGLEIVDGKNRITAKVGKTVQMRIICDKVDIQSPTGFIQAQGNVKLTSQALDAQCDRLTIQLETDAIVLQGDTQLKFKRETQEVELRSDRFSLRLGELKVATPPTPPVGSTTAPSPPAVSTTVVTPLRPPVVTVRP